MENPVKSADYSQSDVIKAPVYGLPNQGKLTEDAVVASGPREKSPRRKAFEESSKGVNSWLLMLLTFVFGFVYSEMIFRGGVGLGVTVVTLLFYVLFTAFIIKKGKKPTVSSILLAVPILVTAVSFSFNASFEGRFWITLGLILMYIAQTASMSRCTSESPLSTRGAYDALYTHSIGTFENIGAAFSSLKRRRNQEKSEMGTGLKVFLGVLISIPVIVILIAFFASADAAFGQMIESAIEQLEKINISFSGLILDIILGSVLCLYFFPLVLTLRSGYCEEKKEHTVKRWLDPVIGVTVVIAATLVYLLFVAVQFNYFFAVKWGYLFNYNFNNAPYLPEGMTWAEYARSGFFELSGIIIATFAAVAAIIVFCKRRGDGKMSVIMRIALTVLSLCNLAIVASAVLRMRLYTIWCGFTAKRVGVLIIIGVFFIYIAAAIIKLWCEKFNLMRFAAIIAVCAIAGFSCMNIDAVCAKLNVDRHLNEKTSIDMAYLGELSYAAAPSVERLMLKSPDENIRLAAKGIIAKYYYYGDGESSDNQKMTDIPIGKWTLDHRRAYEIFLKYSPEKSCADDYGLYAKWQTIKAEYEREYNRPYYYSFEVYKQKAENEDFYYYDQYDYVTWHWYW